MTIIRIADLPLHTILLPYPELLLPKRSIHVKSFQCITAAPWRVKLQDSQDQFEITALQGFDRPLSGVYIQRPSLKSRVRRQENPFV